MSAWRKVPKHHMGESRYDTVKRLRDRLAGLEDLRRTYIELNGDFERIKQINKRINTTKNGIKSAGEQNGF